MMCPDLAHARPPARGSRDVMPAMRFHGVQAILMAVAFALCVLVLPSSAQASVEMPETNIFAVVMTNGDLYVSERRSFEFEDDANGVYWSFKHAENAQGVVAEPSLEGVYEVGDDGSLTSYSLVPQASNGDAGAYTVDFEEDATKVKVFSPHEEGERLTLAVDYVLPGAVMAWADTAELYWQFVGSEWDEPSENVTLGIGFEGDTGEAGGSEADSQVRAWGHGPLDGTVDITRGNVVVNYRMPRVSPGEFAEARVVFPAAWVPGLSAYPDARLQTVLDEEQAWADEANARRERARAISAAAATAQIAAPAVLLAVALWGRFKKYANPRPVFVEDYFRDVPSQDHPAVLSAFMAGGSVEPRAFVATLMKLTDDGVVALGSEVREEKRLFGTKQVDSYILTLVDIDRATDPVDRDAIALYFGTQAKNGDTVSFDMAMTVDDEDSSTSDALDDFRATVCAQLEARNLTSSVPPAYEITMVGLAFAMGVASMMFSLFMELTSVGLFIVSAALCVAAAIFVAQTKCFTSEAVELRGRCEALKRWLEDFTNLGEAVPGDVVLWNKLLVMAVAFGVSDEVLRQLADAVPVDLRGSDEMGYYYPVYWWCYPHGRLGSPTSSLGHAYKETVSQLAESVDSSGGGFGGGFSGGGGGGVGGGGGGTF